MEEQGAKPKRRKKMQYATIDEQWGEEELEQRREEGVDGHPADKEEESGVVRNDCSNGGAKKRLRFASLTSLITEYYPKSKRMNDRSGVFDDEEEWFTGWASNYRGVGGEDRTGSEYLRGNTMLPGGLGGAPEEEESSMTWLGSKEYVVE